MMAGGEPVTGAALGVGVVGAGRAGVAVGATLAHVGHRVTCIDTAEPHHVAALAKGRVPFHEPGLEKLLKGGIRQERLRFSTELAGVVPKADALFVAVDTPHDEDVSADRSSVREVARSIGRALCGAQRNTPLVVVDKSTAPVGSGDYVSMFIREGFEEAGGSEAAFWMVSNPEFMRNGSAIYDCLFPDRIVVGVQSRKAADFMRALYEPIIEQSFPTELDPRPKVAVPFLTTDLASAEMIKYASNAFLATKISLMNEVANICELVGADVRNVALGIGLDERIGPRFLSAGIGWGGSRFHKDVSALRAVAREYEHTTPLLDATVAVNERQLEGIIRKLQHNLHTLRGKGVALLGLSFKPGIDDLREAPSFKIARVLNSMGARVVGYDPVNGKAARSLGSLKVVSDAYEALKGMHAAVLVNEWDELRGLDFGRVAELMRKPPVLIDGRNAVDPQEVRAAGIRYRSFGCG
jgi:UDPglucose 6-dehydrogenase